MSEEFLKNYEKFVGSITSEVSNDTNILINRLALLEAASNNTNIALLLTSALGIGDEAGEFSGLVKKIVFHNKELTPEVHEHLVRELGDVIWYWVNAARALGVDPHVVIETNVKKLESRYPGGFDAWRSDNKDPDDT